MNHLKYRDNLNMIDNRKFYNGLGSLSVYKNNRKKVLFLPGQGINAQLCKILLERTGWLNNGEIDFVICDAPFEMNSFTDDKQLKMLGLDSFVNEGLYKKGSKYKEWRAGFKQLVNIFESKECVEFDEKDQENWNLIINYLKDIIKTYGPFDGVIGFCEGAAVASVALNLQEQGEDIGLDYAKFFIAMSPWNAPFYQTKGLYDRSKLNIPTLQIVGTNDMDIFLNSANRFKHNFNNIKEYLHSGEHTYPYMVDRLKKEISDLMNRQ